MPTNPTVDVLTCSGTVRGAIAHGLAVFTGIPYAAPPTGPLRWRPPTPIDPWDGVHNALDFGPAAPQTPDEHEIAPGTPQSEDCLTLNVWTPAADDAARPVLVWIHGGAFAWGSARNDLYDGAAFARRGDVVVVSIQYRLGAFGWLDLSGVGGDEFATSGNSGLLDQICALEWVRDNIAAFGGDPAQVTLAGESAGAISIGSILAVPAARGLFHRAILQSGSPSLVATREWSHGVATEFMQAAAVQSIDELRGLSTQQILDAQQKLFDSQFSDTAFHPVVDGHLLTQPPLHALAERSRHDVPVLIGTTRDELRLWIYYFDYLDRLPLSYIRPWLDVITSHRAEEIVGVYRRHRPAATDGQLSLAIAGDAAFRLPAIRLAEQWSGRGRNVWMYLFTVESTELDGRLGSPHAVDLPFVFNNLQAEGANDFFGSRREDAALHRLADRVQDSWIAFVRTGDPTTTELPAWPEYTTAERATMIFDVEPEVQTDPSRDEREVWAGVAFDGITPSLRDIGPLTFPGTKTTLPLLIAIAGPRRLMAAGAALAGGALVAAAALRARSN